LPLSLTSQLTVPKAHRVLLRLVLTLKVRLVHRAVLLDPVLSLKLTPHVVVDTRRLAERCLPLLGTELCRRRRALCAHHSPLRSGVADRPRLRNSTPWRRVRRSHLRVDASVKAALELRPGRLPIVLHQGTSKPSLVV
jgi:hypothetical protein